jgi:hypothetical protein
VKIGQCTAIFLSDQYCFSFPLLFKFAVSWDPGLLRLSDKPTESGTWHWSDKIMSRIVSDK